MQELTQRAEAFLRLLCGSWVRRSFAPGTRPRWLSLAWERGMTRLPTRPRPVSSQHQGLLVSLWSRGEHSSSTRRWLHLPTRRPLQVRLRTHQSRRKIGHLLPNQVGGVKKRVANHVPRNPVNIRINVLLLNNRKSTGTSSSLYLVPGKALKLWLMDCTFRCPYIDCTNSDSTRGFRLLKNVRVSNVCVDASAAIHPTDL